MNTNTLDLLTEVELETESKFIFSLCEAIRDMDIQEREMACLDSFIQWASNFRSGNAQEVNVESESKLFEVRKI